MCARSTGLHTLTSQQIREEMRETSEVFLSLFGGTLHVRHLLALVRDPGGNCESEGVCEG